MRRGKGTWRRANEIKKIKNKKEKRRGRKKNRSGREEKSNGDTQAHSQTVRLLSFPPIRSGGSGRG